MHACAPAAAFISGSWLVVRKMDDLPESAQTFLHAAMRHSRPGMPAIAVGIPLSKHVAYKLDTWWFSQPDSAASTSISFLTELAFKIESRPNAERAGRPLPFVTVV